MKFLIVDDSRAMRMLVRRAIRQAGYDVEYVEAENGKQAYDNLSEGHTYDLVLMDWNMPEMTGIEVAETLQRDGKRVKFGFITTESTAPMRKKAADAGALFLLAKPFNADDLKTMLDRVL